MPCLQNTLSTAAFLFPGLTQFCPGLSDGFIQIYTLVIYQVQIRCCLTVLNCPAKEERRKMRDVMWPAVPVRLSTRMSFWSPIGNRHQHLRAVWFFWSINLPFCCPLSVPRPVQTPSLHQGRPVLPRAVPRRLPEGRLGQQLRGLPRPPAPRGLRGDVPPGLLHLQRLALRLLRFLPGAAQQMQAGEGAQERRVPRVRHPQRCLHPWVPLRLHHRQLILVSPHTRSARPAGTARSEKLPRYLTRALACL